MTLFVVRLQFLDLFVFFDDDSFHNVLTTLKIDLSLITSIKQLKIFFLLKFVRFQIPLPIFFTNKKYTIRRFTIAFNQFT